MTQPSARRRRRPCRLRLDLVGVGEERFDHALRNGLGKLLLGALERQVAAGKLALVEDEDAVCIEIVPREEAAQGPGRAPGSDAITRGEIDVEMEVTD